MDTSFVFTWKELLIFAIIVLAVYVAEMLLLMRKGRSSGLFGRSRRETAELSALQDQVAAMEKRLALLEKSGLVADSMDNEAPTTPYGKAFTLAKQGMDVAQVATACGISRAEAELIVAMQHKHLH